MHAYTIIFIGPQGSGKGTQLEKLDATLRAQDTSRPIVAVQTGRLFRALAQKQETYTGRHVGETLDTGILQPDFLTAVLWGEVMIKEVDPKYHPRCYVLIDGFPRTVAQAEILESAFRFYQRDEVTVINFNAPDDVVRARMKSRARSDDTDTAIAERLRLYTQETLPVLDFYRARLHTNILDIDATDTIEHIHEAIVRGLELDASIAITIPLLHDPT